MTTKLVDGDRELNVDDEDIWLDELDLGFPAVRAVVQDRPQADGESDQTAHHGGRAVSMKLRLVPVTRTLTALLDDLMYFCHPGRRPVLVFEHDGSERQITLRADQQSAPITSPNSQAVQVAWRAPTGRILSSTEQVSAANPDAGEPGRAYDLTFDRDYPDSVGIGRITVTNAGTTAADPIIRIFGPCTDPRIANETVDKALEFTGLTIAAGDYLELDPAHRTARLNGLASSSRYGFLNFDTSEWWSLEPGDNTIRFYPVTSSPPSQAQVRWHDAYL